MESGQIVISRAARQSTFPARFQLITAMNPCPCGMAGDDSGRCHCSAEQIQRYRNRISGPLLDRIDIQVEVLRPKRSILSKPTDATESSSSIRSRVIEARHTQLKRAGKVNAFLSNSGLARYCEIRGDTLELLEQAVRQLFLSPRACHRILKVARTIADLDFNQKISTNHIAEAIAFRRINTSGNMF
jgi:magnesium chelatase family protein